MTHTHAGTGTAHAHAGLTNQLGSTLIGTPYVGTPMTLPASGYFPANSYAANPYQVGTSAWAMYNQNASNFPWVYFKATHDELVNEALNGGSPFETKKGFPVEVIIGAITIILILTAITARFAYKNAS